MENANNSANPLSLSKESYDILTMLRMMDRHLEAVEYETKFKHSYKDYCEKKSRSLPVPGEALKKKNGQSGSMIQTLRGRKIIRRVMGVKRIDFEAKAMLHKNKRYSKGIVLDVSKTGIFIKSDRKIFKESEKVRLYIKPKGMDKYYKAIAEVVRFNEDPRFARGYGLRFIIPSNVLNYS